MIEGRWYGVIVHEGIKLSGKEDEKYFGLEW